MADECSARHIKPSLPSTPVWWSVSAFYDGLTRLEQNRDSSSSAPGVFLRPWSSHRGGGGSKRPLLPDLWQDRPLHERLPHAQKVGAISSREAQSCRPDGFNCPVGPGAGPSREGMRRSGPSTCETDRTQEKTAKTRRGRRTSTGGRGTRRRSAAASCVGRAPTSRGTVSWTGTAQVTSGTLPTGGGGGGTRWGSPLIVIEQEIWRWKASPLQLIWGIWGSRSDRYEHTCSSEAFTSQWCFWDGFVLKSNGSFCHNGTCFPFFQKLPLQEDKKKKRQQNLILGPEMGT